MITRNILKALLVEIGFTQISNHEYAKNNM